MSQYASEALSYLICANLHPFPEQESEHCVKPGSKSIQIVDIIESKGFYIGDFGKAISFYHFINQKMVYE